LAVHAQHPNTIFAMWIFLLLAAAAFSLGFLWRTKQAAGASQAPGAGVIMAMGQHELAALYRAWGDRSGFIVWSSTMHGQHELVRMDWPSGQMNRLTKNPAVDSAPKISPDGKQVVFARSRKEWVSFRNPEEWDIWLLDFKGTRERRLAEHGAEPTWTGDGQAVTFQRGGREVVQVEVNTGKESVLLKAQEKTIWTEPSVDPAGGRVAVTVRGKRRSTSLCAVPDGAETRVAGGCQLAFAPDGKWLVLIDDGGNMKNRICRVDREGKNLNTLLDMPGFWSYEYFPRVSNDGELLVFGAAREGHEQDTADFEIFLWHIGDAPEQAARVSFHTGNDQWPDVFVSP
jgi:Tol biopolymer transport system component